MHESHRRAGVSVDRSNGLEAHVDRARQDAEDFGAARDHAVHLGLGVRQSKHFRLSSVSLKHVIARHDDGPGRRSS